MVSMPTTAPSLSKLNEEAMTKLKLQTIWYDQWDKGKPEPSSPPCRSRRIAVTLAVWRNPHTTPAHPTVPDLTIQFSRN